MADRFLANDGMDERLSLMRSELEQMVPTRHLYKNASFIRDHSPLRQN